MYRKPLTRSQVREICFSQKTVPEIAKEFDRSIHVIYLIRRGAAHKKWTKPYRTWLKSQIEA